MTLSHAAFFGRQGSDLCLFYEGDRGQTSVSFYVGQIQKYFLYDPVFSGPPFESIYVSGRRETSQCTQNAGINRIQTWKMKGETI